MERRERPGIISGQKSGSALGVRVVTRASATELAGKNEDDNTVKVRLVAASADDPSANTELLAFLAQKLGIEVSQLEIVAGADKRDKMVSIIGLTTDEVEAKLFNA
jgi:uncharacterized protein YggU (UPF0235/DUF167 family)